MERLPGLIRVLLEKLRDLAPLLLVVGFFYVVVLHVPVCAISIKLTGASLVVMSLTFFVRSLSRSMFSFWESLASTFTRRENVILLLSFAFASGTGATH